MTNKKQSFPFYILLLIPAYIINLALIILFQCVFIHTQKGPLDNTVLKQMEFFDDKEIVDVYNEVESPAFGMKEIIPAFVLYQDKSGETSIVRVQWNPYVLRFGLEEDTAMIVSEKTGEYEVEMNNLLGKNSVTLVDGEQILSVEVVGVTNDRSFNQMIRFLAPFVMMVVEYSIYALIKRVFGKK